MVQKLKKWSKFRLWTKLPKPKDFSGVARPIAVYGLWSESDWSEAAKSRRLSITLNKKRDKIEHFAARNYTIRTELPPCPNTLQDWSCLPLHH